MVHGDDRGDENGRTGVFGGAENCAQLGATPANSIFVNDSDGRIRHLAFNIQGIQTFPVVAAGPSR